MRFGKPVLSILEKLHQFEVSNEIRHCPPAPAGEVDRAANDAVAPADAPNDPAHKRSAVHADAGLRVGTRLTCKEALSRCRGRKRGFHSEFCQP